MNLDLEQGSDEWKRARLGVMTGSKLGKCFTSKLGISKAGCKTLAKTLACELMHKKNESLPSQFINEHMIRGSLMEEEAGKALAFQYDQYECRDGGFYLDGNRGASPDLRFYQNDKLVIGAEIKCPKMETHLEYLLNGGTPPEYYPQIHLCMLMTGLDKWIFCSYYPSANIHVYEQEKDEAFCDKIEEVFQITFEMVDEYAKVLGV